MEHTQRDSGTLIRDGEVWMMSLKEDGTVSLEFNRLESSIGKNSMNIKYRDLKSRKSVES